MMPCGLEVTAHSTCRLNVWVAGITQYDFVSNNVVLEHLRDEYCEVNIVYKHLRGFTCFVIFDCNLLVISLLSLTAHFPQSVNHYHSLVMLMAGYLIVMSTAWFAGTSVDSHVFNGETIDRLRFSCCQFVWTCRVCNCDCVHVLVDCYWYCATELWQYCATEGFFSVLPFVVYLGSYVQSKGWSGKFGSVISNLIA